MPKRVQLHITIDVALDDPAALSDAACRMYAQMDSDPPGGDPLPADLERDLRAKPGFALQALIDASRLLAGVPGVSFERAELLVEPHEP